MNFVIKKGQKDFCFKCGLPEPEDYGITAIPSWSTTWYLVEKTNEGFILGFGTAPDKIASLDLTLYTPLKPEIEKPQKKSHK